MGYWLVVAMLACAVAAVALALAADDGSGRPLPRVRRVGDQLVWAALGASDATGHGTPNPARDNWVARLAAVLPADVVVRNFGVSGSHLADARRDQLPRALTASPDVVSCWLVVNDLLSGVPLSAYERDLAALLTALRDAGCRVVLGNVPDLSRVPALGAVADQATLLRLSAEHWNAAIARLAFAFGAELVDLFAEGEALAGRPDYFGPDGFHPSPAGHQRLAALFRPVIERALEAARDDKQPAAEEADGHRRAVARYRAIDGDVVGS